MTAHSEAIHLALVEANLTTLKLSHQVTEPADRAKEGRREAIA